MAKSRHQRRLNQRRMAATRRAVLRRDSWTCQLCGKVGGAVECDHVIPMFRSNADPYDPSSCQTLCRGCHLNKSAGESGRELPAGYGEWKEAVAAMVRGQT